MSSQSPVEPGNYSLASKYTGTSGEVFLTGIQALARIPIDQLRRDRLAGKNTAAFISGYPGSPLGGFDLEMTRARSAIGDALPIEHLPAVNEELGATAVMGSQLASARSDLRYDGVVGIWYGKAPGLDRATDALRHAVFAGASSQGGALALVGDDPSAKSSTMPSSSDAALVDLHMPVLYPANASECLELGLHGVEMSRATGLWSALKVVTAVADGSGTVALPVCTSETIYPFTEAGERWDRIPSSQFLGPRMVQVEREFHEIRTGLALRYGQANKLNRIETKPDKAWLGVVATGFTFGEVIEAFRRLGFPTLSSIADAGIRLLNLRMPIPFDAELVTQFASGLEHLLVVEEKNPTLETLVRSALYTTAVRPDVHGKIKGIGESAHNGATAPTLPAYGRLDADAIAPVLRTHLEPRLSDLLTPLKPKPRERIPLTVMPATTQRAPFFCSGCPHNWGTKVPADAVVGMGTGCHGMTLLMDEERVGDSIGITAMGNEGAQWLGMKAFVDTDHIFQNFGDGTFMHSGQLAVQAAIGAEANVTFKILYNHTVAMTGGQDASHFLDPAKMATVLLAHGAKKVVITTDNVANYDDLTLPDGVNVLDRSRIVEVQEELAKIKGVTILIHDQGCAAELRRDRKRGRIEQPKKRIVINHRICEGCGDCGDVSNCLSVQPIETPLGRKTTIDQASCNFDYSCIKGDCPAFMTVDSHPADQTSGPALLDDLPVDGPTPPDRTATVVRFAGIGGTGVVTVAQILGTAATLDGLVVAGLDQTGLSQKAGPVISDLTISSSKLEPRSNAPGAGQADVLLAFDLLVAASDSAIHALDERTAVFASTSSTPTGRQITDPGLEVLSVDQLAGRIEAKTGSSATLAIDVFQAAEALSEAGPSANIMLLGSALQAGQLPVTVESLRSAIELNGVNVEGNLAALEWGRRLVSHPDETAQLIEAHGAATPTMTASPLPKRLIKRISQAALPADQVAEFSTLAADLVDYQNVAYAERFLDLVETANEFGDEQFTAAVARSFHKLMAYKDEYEVARLLIHPDGLAAADQVGTNRRWHLHPPTLKSLGRKAKIEFGPKSASTFRALAKGKRLRGTKLDPFGMTAMRRMERALIDEFEEVVQTIVTALGSRSLTQQTESPLLPTAIQIALLPDMIRGYEELKFERVDAYRSRLAELLTAFD